MYYVFSNKISALKMSPKYNDKRCPLKLFNELEQVYEMKLTQYKKTSCHLE